MKMMTCISITPALCEIAKAQCNRQQVSFSGTIEELLLGWLTPAMRAEYDAITHVLSDIGAPSKHNKTGFRGVKEKKPSEKNKLKTTRYSAEIASGGIKRSLGHFMTAEEAARAYDRALVKKTLESGAALRSIIRVLNFPLENYVTIKEEE